jgi:NTE family protein
VDGISGTSAGAMNGAVLADGWAEGGPEGARDALARFWARVARAALFSPFRRTPLDILLGAGRSTARPPFWRSTSRRACSRPMT